MLTYYCPNCWSELVEGETVCPACGFEVVEFDAYSFEEKLLAALHHSVPERRNMAAQILGNRASQRGLIEFEKIIDSGEIDYFFLRAILLATVKIEHPNRLIILHKASRHSSDLVANLARDLLAKLKDHQHINKWDLNTG